MKARIYCGDDLLFAEIPDDTRVIAPPGDAPVQHGAEQIIARALDDPHDSPTLSELVTPSSRVVIAFDDNALPIPKMRHDLRPVAIGIIIERLTRAGVRDDNLRLICAQGLHRKLTYEELVQLAGPNTFQRLSSARIANHDAEDPEGLEFLGVTDCGEEVEINRVAAQADLVIYVNINWTQMNGGWKSLAVGLGSYRSIRHHHNPGVLGASGSLMDPGGSEMHRSYERMGAIIGKHVRCVTLEMALDMKTWWGPWAGLSLMPHQTPPAVEAKIARLLPQRARDFLRNAITADYGLRAAHFGQVDAVHERTLAVLDDFNSVTVQGQTDALLIGLADLGPYCVGGYSNPVLVMNSGLGYAFNMHQGSPLLREGGTLILSNPCRPRFHPVHHPSYKRFFEEVLPQTTDPAVMHEHYEAAYAGDQEYRRLYRDEYAFHGVHPFYAWYWGCHARAHVGRVIVAGAVAPAAVERMGFEAAPTVEHAIDMARESHGRSMTLSYQMIPPVYVCRKVDWGGTEPLRY